jgi:hypothetical protein
MDAIDRLVAYFESLDRDGVARIGEYYAPRAWFKDPFNEVRGAAAIGAVFARMFEQVDHPRFRVHGRVFQGAEGFLIWDFEFRLRGHPAPQSIHGVSHLKLDAQGRVSYHRDYWDPAEELYEKIPLLRGPMRWLKRRARH